MYVARVIVRHLLHGVGSVQTHHEHGPVRTVVLPVEGVEHDRIAVGCPGGPVRFGVVAVLPRDHSGFAGVEADHTDLASGLHSLALSRHQQLRAVRREATGRGRRERIGADGSQRPVGLEVVDQDWPAIPLPPIPDDPLAIGRPVRRDELPGRALHADDLAAVQVDDAWFVVPEHDALAVWGPDEVGATGARELLRPQDRPSLPHGFGPAPPRLYLEEALPVLLGLLVPARELARSREAEEAVGTVWIKLDGLPHLGQGLLGPAQDREAIADGPVGLCAAPVAIEDAPSLRKRSLGIAFQQVHAGSAQHCRHTRWVNTQSRTEFLGRQPRLPLPEEQLAHLTARCGAQWVGLSGQLELLDRAVGHPGLQQRLAENDPRLLVAGLGLGPLHTQPVHVRNLAGTDGLSHRLLVVHLRSRGQC